MDRTVAVKVMLPSVAANSKAGERFAQECKLAGRLNHPNIVSVYDVGFVTPNEPYLVMEYIDGQSLAQELSLKGPPPLEVAANIFTQVLRGLEEAHSAGIIHRDLKPDNILLQRKSNRLDWVKIVDFGIANLADGSKRLTKVGAFIGTPNYMAPEQFKSKPLDIRVDLYSLGIVLFETLTGVLPYDGDSPEAIIMKHLMDEPPELATLRPDAPQCLGTILKKALAKDPSERFQNPVQFRQALESCIQAGL
jgi:serine/threonine-protein kinase